MVRLEELGKFKKFNYLIGTRTRDFLVYRTASQPFTPTCVPSKWQRWMNSVGHAEAFLALCLSVSSRPPFFRNSPHKFCLSHGRCNKGTWQALPLHATKILGDSRVINFFSVVLLQLVGWRFQHVIPVCLIVSFQTTADSLEHMQQGTTSTISAAHETSMGDNSLSDSCS
jgi:hypothetical protein